MRVRACVALLVLALASAAGADPLTVAWDESTDPAVAGYVVSVGTSPGVYTQTHDVGDTTWYTFPDAEPGRRYCFAVASYAPGPIVGPPSNAVCGASDTAPALQDPGPITSQVGEAATLQLAGYDPDGRAVSYGAAGLPPGLTLTPATGFIAGVPLQAGVFTVAASVHDGVLSASRSFIWTVVAPVPHTPATSGDPPPAEPVPPLTPDALPNVDVHAPLTVTSVHRGPGNSTAAPLAIVSGTTAPSARVVEVFWSSGDRQGRATGSVSWTARIPLRAGANAITISARTANGQTFTQHLMVDR